MLFTTAVFAAVYLPIVLAGFFVCPTPRAAAAWLLLASLFFYGWWVPQFTLLLLASIGVNFAIGTRILAQARRAAHSPAGRSAGAGWMLLGVIANLALLGWFKYANFFVDNLGALTGIAFDLPRVALPIGISFFTFTQIAFLVDARRGKVDHVDLVHYGLFVTYFPHLIAGPILHHGQMIPQFEAVDTYRPNASSIACGMTIFALGLLKKVVFADGISPYADAVFVAADAGTTPSAEEAWLGALAYALQIYFDFSGYSDMAIGISRLFNVRLPINFNSPYRSTSITEFWRRWHISLSTFLRDYLYIALGGNRKGSLRRHINLMLTMLLGGLWHGANWTFVVWGSLHGLYLIANHLTRGWRGPPRPRRAAARYLGSATSWLLTMVAVLVAWVFFRATTLSGALNMLAAMTCAPWPQPSALLAQQGLTASAAWSWCAALVLVALVPVNSNALGAWIESAAQRSAFARRFATGAALTAAAALVLLNTARDSASAFIYFNF